MTAEAAGKHWTVPTSLCSVRTRACPQSGLLLESTDSACKSLAILSVLTRWNVYRLFHSFLWSYRREFTFKSKPILRRKCLMLKKIIKKCWKNIYSTIKCMIINTVTNHTTHKTTLTFNQIIIWKAIYTILRSRAFAPMF